jgi:hypothetical protein
MLADEKDGNYFQDLYRNDIIGYFRDEVMRRYEPQIKIDVIEALEREYRSTTMNFEESNVVHYVTGEIDKVKKLAAPFLEQPLGEERHPIQACAYNPVIEGDSDPRRKALIDEHLGNYGGERDSEISPQEILFYSAIYGIRARDLSKYAPARREITEKRPAGSYFSAYHQLVSGIRPSVTETRVITPHLDRRWHTIASMPDLDEGYQEHQLAVVHEALLTGLAYKVIVWETVHDDTCIYRYRPAGSLEREFVVSNGTPCDQFYEVEDALMINPVAVNEVLDTVSRRIANYLEEEPAASFDKSPFADALSRGISLGELDSVVPGMKGRRATVFDVAAFYAVSVPKVKYTDAALRDMIVHFLEYVRSQVEGIADPGEVTPVLEKTLRRQYADFHDNVPAYLDAMGPSFARRIRTILRPLSEMVADLHLRAFATEVEGFEESLRSL